MYPYILNEVGGKIKILCVKSVYTQELCQKLQKGFDFYGVSFILELFFVQSRQLIGTYKMHSNLTLTARSFF